MNENVANAIKEHAIDEYPRECCGLVVDINGAERYLPCRNVGAGNDAFALHHEDYAKAAEIGEILMVVHSHPDANPRPSMADRVSCERSGKPWHIVSVGKKMHGNKVTITVFDSFTLQPVGYCAPLEGRPFVHGVLDCYSLIKDYYREILQIELLEIEREDEWWNKGGNMYLDNFQAAGFSRVMDGSLQFGDVILMQIRSPVPNHGAVYIGQDQIMHHLTNRLSGRDLYDGYFKDVTRMVVRHKDMPQ